MSKIILGKNHPLWRAVREEQAHLVAGHVNGVTDPRAKQSVELSDVVTDMLSTGGVIQLKDATGALCDVKIKGLDEA